MGRSNEFHDVFKWIDTHDNDPKPCWEWLGSLGGRDGRGYFAVHGQKYLAHRIVYQLFNGPIPKNKVVRHTCDNQRCCNPKHLELGNQSQNETDKYLRGRAGYPLHVVNEINKQLRRARREGVNITDREIKEHIKAQFGLDISISGIARVRRGERRLVNR